LKVYQLVEGNQLLEEDSLEIYVDSSTSQVDKSGAVGIRVITIDSNGNEVSYDFQSAGYRNVNSGQMEIIACTYALEEAMDRQLIFQKKRVTIFTDSKYVANNYKNAMFHWIGNRWCWNDGRPVSDAPEWKRLVRSLRNYFQFGLYVDIKWIKGHDKARHNVAVDKLAKDILRLPPDLYPKNTVISVFRPEQVKSPVRLEIGSVKMEGQKISIKILAVEYLPIQKFWSCKYQVISKQSPYRGLVDKAFSIRSLDIGKCYYVKFNSNQSIPQIDKVYWEIGNIFSF
jgi:ribonuclease HI